MNFLNLLLKLSSVSAITSVIVLCSSLILGRIMAPQHFGQYSFFQSVLMILVNISSMAGGLSISIFMFRSPQSKLNRILSNTLFMVIPLFFMLAICFLFFVFIYNKRFDVIFFILLVNSVLMSICLLAIDFLRMKQDVMNYSIIYFFYTAGIAVFSVIGYWFFKDVFYVYFASALSLLFPMVFSVRIFINNFNLTLRYKHKMKTLLWSYKFGLPVVLSTVASSFLVVGDKIILGTNMPKEKLAEYSIAALISSTSLFFVNNFSSAWSSFLFKRIPSIVQVSGREGVVSYFNLFKTRLFLVLPISIVLYILQYSIYYMFLASKYPGLEVPIYCLTLGYCIFGAAKYFISYLNYLGRNIVNFYSACIGCFVMFFLPVFTFGFAVNVMAFSVLFSFLCQFVFLLYFTNYEINKYVRLVLNN